MYCVSTKTKYMGTLYNSVTYTIHQYITHIFEFCLRDLRLSYWIINYHDLQFLNFVFWACAKLHFFGVLCFRGHAIFMYIYKCIMLYTYVQLHGLYSHVAYHEGLTHFNVHVSYIHDIHLVFAQYTRGRS